jgi:hypothetical protein
MECNSQNNQLDTQKIGIIPQGKILTPAELKAVLNAPLTPQDIQQALDLGIPVPPKVLATVGTVKNAAYNVAMLARNDEFCFLEFDVADGFSGMCKNMGKEKTQLTRAQRSGRGGTQLIFRHTPRSVAVGNRSVNLPHLCSDPDCEKSGGGTHHHEWFSFRAHNKYLVGANSLHPNGRRYKLVWDIEPEPIPDWVLDFIERHSEPEITINPHECRPVSDDFDFDDMLDHFGISILGVKDDLWHVVEECPGVDRRHENSTLTAFYWDGNSLGWSCFAQECPVQGVGIGGLLKFLNTKMIEAGGEPYKGSIWSSSETEALVWEDVEVDFDDPVVRLEPTPGAPPVVQPEVVQAEVSAVVAKAPVIDQDVIDIIDEMVALDAPLPPPRAVAIEDPENHQGLEFPGECAMYGKAQQIAKKFPRLQLGWLYPAILGSASALDIQDVDRNVKSNLYVALLGEVADGKTACMDAALGTIFHPELSLIRESPGGHRGLANSLSDSEPLPFLLALDDLRTLLNASGYRGSNLPAMLCDLWSHTRSGASDKKGRQPCYGKLSILGGLSVTDQSEFAKLFGSNTVAGLADRFLFGYSSTHVKYRPVPTKPEVIDLKEGRVPEWVWDVKDEWAGDIRAITRVTTASTPD